MRLASARLLQAGSIGCALLFVQVPALAIEGFDVPKELALCASGLFALACAGRGLQLDRVDRLFLYSALWTALCALAGGGLYVGIRGTLLCIGASATFIAAREAARDHRPALLGAAALAAAVIATSMLLEAHGIIHLSLSTRAPGGLLGHRNYAAYSCVLSLPVFLWLLCQSAPRARPLLLGGLSLVIAALVLTRSRTAWAAAALCCLIFAIAAARLASPLRRSLSICAAIALGIAAAVLPGNRLEWKSTRPIADTLATLAEFGAGSGAGRVAQYRNTLGMIRDHPLFGVGPGGWTVEYSRYAPPGDPTFKPLALWQAPPRATSDWLGITAERGLIGLLLLLLPFVLMIRAALRQPANLESAALYSLLAALLPLTALDCPLQVAPLAQSAFLAAGAFAAFPIGILKPARFQRWAVPIGLFSILYLGAHLLGGVLADFPSMPTRDLGARLAPANPRIQILVGAGWSNVARFDRCLSLADRALADAPTYLLARHLKQECEAHRPVRTNR